MLATLPGDSLLFHFDVFGVESGQDLFEIGDSQIYGQASLLSRRQTSVGLIDRKQGLLPDLGDYRIAVMECNLEGASLRMLRETGPELTVLPIGQGGRVVAAVRQLLPTLQSLPLFTVNQ